MVLLVFAFVIYIPLYSSDDIIISSKVKRPIEYHLLKKGSSLSSRAPPII